MNVALARGLQKVSILARRAEYPRSEFGSMGVADAKWQAGQKRGAPFFLFCPACHFASATPIDPNSLRGYSARRARIETFCRPLASATFIQVLRLQAME